MVLKPGAVGGCPGTRSWLDMRMATGEAVVGVKANQLCKRTYFQCSIQRKSIFM